MSKIDFDIVDDKIFVNCPSCKHSFQLGHTEWSAILCPNCKAILRQEEDSEEEDEEVFDIKDSKAIIPCVIIAKKECKLLEVMIPTDALFILNSGTVKEEDLNFITEGEFTIGMQKLVDILICHPDFFPCLDVAIDSDPRDRKVNRLLMKAKKQPEN